MYFSINSFCSLYLSSVSILLICSFSVRFLSSSGNSKSPNIFNSFKEIPLLPNSFIYLSITVYFSVVVPLSLPSSFNKSSSFIVFDVPNVSPVFASTIYSISSSNFIQ